MWWRGVHVAPDTSLAPRSPQRPRHRQREWPAGPGGRSPHQPLRASRSRGSLGRGCRSRSQARNKAWKGARAVPPLRRSAANFYAPKRCFNLTTPLCCHALHRARTRRPAARDRACAARSACRGRVGGARASPRGFHGRFQRPLQYKVWHRISCHQLPPAATRGRRRAPPDTAMAPAGQEQSSGLGSLRGPGAPQQRP